MKFNFCRSFAVYFPRETFRHFFSGMSKLCREDILTGKNLMLGGCDHSAELILEEDSHLIERQARLFRQVVRGHRAHRSLAVLRLVSDLCELGVHGR
jgi:hypothetical protein